MFRLDDNGIEINEEFVQRLGNFSIGISDIEYCSACLDEYIHSLNKCNTSKSEKERLVQQWKLNQRNKNIILFQNKSSKDAICMKCLRNALEFGEKEQICFNPPSLEEEVKEEEIASKKGTTKKNDKK